MLLPGIPPLSTIKVNLIADCRFDAEMVPSQALGCKSKTFLRMAIKPALLMIYFA